MNKYLSITSFILPLSVGLIVSVFPYLGYGFQFLPGDLGDTRFNLFLLEHGSKFFLGEVEQFWSASFIYPESEVIAISDNLLGVSPFFMLFRIFGLNIFTSFQCWVVLMAILNYWSAFKLSDYILKNKWLAGLSAFTFAFSISLASQMNHAQTFPRFTLPLVILGLLLWRKHLNWKYFALSITMLVYQFYCGIYLGFFTLIPFLALFFIIVYSNYKVLLQKLKIKKEKALYAISILLNLFFLFILFAPYIRRSKSAHLNSFEEISHTLPSLKSYLTSSPGTILHKPLEEFIGKDHPAFWDHNLFAGWIVITFFIISIVLLLKRWFGKSKVLSRKHYLILLTGFITFIVFLRIEDISIYFLIHQLPGFSALRSFTRVINVQLLFFGVTLGIVTLYFIKKRQISSQLIFMIILPLLVLDNYIYFDSAHKISKSKLEARHASMVEKMDHLPKGTVIAYEPEVLEEPAYYYQLDAMLAAQSLILKTVNGYTAQAPLDYDEYWALPNEENRAIWFNRFPNSDTISVVIIK